MKKGVVFVLLTVAFIIGGVVCIIIGGLNYNAVKPIDYNTLSYDQIESEMYISSDATIVYDSFAYLGDNEVTATELYYITIIGMDTDNGAQYMPFTAKASNKALVNDHVEKTYAWETDGDLESPIPTGYHIKGVVKTLPPDAKAFFVEYFVDTGMYIQDDVDAFPELFSDYYIDTNAMPSNSAFSWPIIIGVVLFMLAFMTTIKALNIAKVNHSNASYDYDNAKDTNLANTSLADSTDTPLGFE